MPDDLVTRHAKPVPRYTSYPTAPQFHAGVGNDNYHDWLEKLPVDATLSLYLHIPYCDRLCWFCGCHTKQTLRYEPITTYLGALYAEIAAVGARLAGRGRVTALHLGGGSPSMLKPDDLAALRRLLRDTFVFAGDAEISIEINPNDMDAARYDGLAAFGTTRISLGVQDFNPLVQRAINRIQTFEQTREVVEAMRARGVRSVNLDVLYGLPHQSVATIEETAAQALSLAPDRLAIFGYAHVPWLKAHQRMIDEAALPGVAARLAQASVAAGRIVAAGYEAIGIDHFARPGDSLARAARDGRLRRNFQGYTSDAATALIGFGASSIGQFPQGYVQNIVATGDYQRRVLAEGTAIGRGLVLSDDDRARAFVIERLMCDFAVSRAALKVRFGPTAAPILTEMHYAVTYDPDGLTAFRGDLFAVTPKGRPFVRSIASAFDSYLNASSARYSAAV